MAIVKWLERFGRLSSFKRVLLLCDNKAACTCMSKGFSDLKGMDVFVRRARELVCEFGLVLRVAYISTRSNVIADALSHLLYDQAKWQTERVFGLPLKLRMCPPCTEMPTRS